MQAARQLQHRSAALEKYRISIEDQFLRFTSDGIFLLAIAARQGFVRGLKSCARHSRYRAAVGANEHPFLFEGRQVPANRGRRDLEYAAKLRRADRTFRG